MRNLFLLLAILCNCYVYSQLPVIPVPQVGNLGTYGTDMNTKPHSIQGNPFARLGYKADVYTFGETKEFHDLDVVVEIGEVLFNTETNEVVGFIEDNDSLIELKPELQSMSIDPHCEKYYSISPYAYCMNNPVRFVDPDGKDVWELQPNGTVTWIKESEKHTMYALNEDGERTGASITISDRSIFDQLTENDGQGTYAISSSHETGDVFLFAADNTNVEWGLDGFQGKNSRNYLIYTNKDKESVSRNDMGNEGLTMANQFFAMHSHPDPNGTKGGSGYGRYYGGDRRYIINKYKSAKEQGIPLPTYYVYHKHSNTIYQYTPWSSDIYIKKVTNNKGLRFIIPKR